jgi:glycosyltransferase involved in cell wall biosynthesis
VVRHSLPPTAAASSVGHPAGPKDVERGPLRCLWLTRMDPVSPDAGDLAYSFHLLSSLSRAGARLTVLAMRRTGERPRTAEVDGIEWVIVPWEGGGKPGRGAAQRSLFSRLPNVAKQHHTPSFRRALRREMARGWDAIAVDHLGMGWVWPSVQAYRRRNAGVVLIYIAHGYESDFRRAMAQNFKGYLFHKLALRVDAVKAGRLERGIARSATLFSAITSEDQNRFGGLPNSIVLTPGYADAGMPADPRTITATTPRRVVLFGSALWLAKQMNLIEFVEAADELFARQQIELWVVGRVPDNMQWRSVRATRFLGFVEDPQPIFHSARMGIVPERTGGGFKLKTLDYIFNRVPIAALSGSTAGLPLRAGWHYLSFQSIRELAQGVAAAIDNLELLNNLQETAYAECRSRFDWADRGRALYEAMLQARRRQQNPKGHDRKYS